MCKIFFFLSLFVAINFSSVLGQQDKPIALALHGGAGNILPESIDKASEKAYLSKLEEALDAGYSVLEAGGSSLDAVVTAIYILEQSPLFNAGIGSVLNADGKCELDASIMNGNNLAAGAVAGVRRVKSPIAAARAVMERSSHVMLSGEGAELFAASQKLEMVENDYFYTEKRKESLKKVKEKEKENDDNEGRGRLNESNNYKFGTVGVVALDKNGDLAAGTSTGGMTNKRFGRIGDSPIIGAGTYADNQTCAVSSTGHGEFFIRAVVAYRIAALMEYKGLSLQEAADEVIHKKLKNMGGEGGIIAIDKEGNISLTFNTSAMFRAYRNHKGKKEILIFGE
ncbi:MAG: isoaspartyl peptidase/L-asparaginase [Bernardetiaceae bacterium]|nr:isoaspartyl peptidase/L-asparaginase [Bernardetiaceae bacterium]